MLRILRCGIVLLVGFILVAWMPLLYQAPEYDITITTVGELLLMPRVAPQTPKGIQEIDNLEKLAMADLGARLHLETSDISLWSVRQVTFRDSSLGKPLPGRMYAQVITPGYAITLRAGDALYLYHGAGRNVVYIGPVHDGPKNLPDSAVN